MGQAKMTTFIIALILISFFSILFSQFISHTTTKYGRPYDNTSLEVYDQMVEINKQVEVIKIDVEASEERPGLLDIIGGYISSAINTIKLAAQSYSLFDKMSNKAIDQANLPIGEPLKQMIGAIVMVLIFLSIIIAAIIKWKV